MKKKDIIGDAQFRVMCDMWGVDNALIALSRMGMGVTSEQLHQARQKEDEAQERWNRVFKKEPKED